jgi:hypothetical protein
MSPTTKMTISLGPTEDMLFPLAARLIRGGGGDFAKKLSQTKPCEAEAVLASQVRTLMGRHEICNAPVSETSSMVT